MQIIATQPIPDTVEDRLFTALTPKEAAEERRAAEEERAKRAWLGDSPAALARRIPTSVFALGSLSTGGH